MECPRCENGVLEKEGKLSFKCPKCGLFLGPLGDESGKETAQDESKSITGLSSTQEVVLDSNVVTDRTVSTDGKLALLQLTCILKIKELQAKLSQSQCM